MFRMDLYPEPSMTPLVEYFIKGWQRSFDYSGRSTRPEYWWFYLANFIVSLLIGVLSAFLDVFGKLLFVYFFASIFPHLSLTIRRLRDSGKAWPWIFISLVPFIGGIWLIILLCQPSVLSLPAV